jgi:hypothetical protein
MQSCGLKWRLETAGMAGGLEDLVSRVSGFGFRVSGFGFRV